MITKIKVKNYKSLHDLNLDVGRFNIFIGENGSGKSNILEAITLAAAAEANKLDNEFLSSRGIRVTDPNFMRSAFKDGITSSPINIEIQDEHKSITKEYLLTNDNKPYSKWTILEDESKTHVKFTNKDIEALFKLLKENEDSLDLRKKENFPSIIFNKIINDSVEKEAFKEFLYYQLNNEKWENLQNFVIYSPENTALRNFYKEGQIEPLGINGEGLLKLLKTIRESAALETKQETNKKGFFSFFHNYNYETDKFSRLNEIHKTLQLFDWYENLEIPKELSESEDKVKITDKYLNDSFDQRSTNEGFLFILFYISLIVSEDTPEIFGIDNIDASLNPKLCSKLITELTRLMKKYDKQVFATTHNPAILDGINLGDDEQRLFVVSRNRSGHTRCKRITVENKPLSSTGEALRLSEAFLRGYLGGLPKGF
ncbi:MAG: AAA family ATPase [Methylomicrobium sp.]|jgi:predicted ATPase